MAEFPAEVREGRRRKSQKIFHGNHKSLEYLGF